MGTALEWMEVADFLVFHLMRVVFDFRGKRVARRDVEYLIVARCCHSAKYSIYGIPGQAGAGIPQVATEHSTARAYYIHPSVLFLGAISPISVICGK